MYLCTRDGFIFGPGFKSFLDFAEGDPLIAEKSTARVAGDLPADGFLVIDANVIAQCGFAFQALAGGFVDGGDIARLSGLGFGGHRFAFLVVD